MLKTTWGLTPKEGVRPLLVFALFFLTTYRLSLTAAFSAGDEVHSLQELFLRGEYPTVVERTRALLPRARHDRDALLYLQGLSALKLRELDLARSSLEALTTQYPKSPFAAQARLALNQLDRPQAAAVPAVFSVQVGAFETRANAAKLAAELERRGYAAQILEAEMNGKPFHRVRVGSYDDRSQAEHQARELKREGFPAQVVP